MSTNYTENIAPQNLAPSWSYKPLEVPEPKKRLKSTQLLLVKKSMQVLNHVFGAVLMRMSDIFIIGQSGAIIGRGDSYQGLSADSYHL